jgi:hypothetical protein
MELVPIRIKIGRALVDGRMQNKYPNFNEIDPTIRHNLDFSFYVDAYGIGWHYDKKSGFGECDDYNEDCDCQYAMTAVPADFAKAAVKLFPNHVFLMTEDEAEIFYNDRAHDHEESEILDVPQLQGIAARVELEKAGVAPPPSKELHALRKRCLDPDDQHKPGIRKNMNKTWKRLKERRGFKHKDV